MHVWVPRYMCRVRQAQGARAIPYPLRHILTGESETGRALAGGSLPRVLRGPDGPDRTPDGSHPGTGTVRKRGPERPKHAPPFAVQTVLLEIDAPLASPGFPWLPVDSDQRLHTCQFGGLPLG